MTGENLQIYGVKIIEKCNLWVKKLNLFVFTHAPSQNSPSGSYHHLPDKRKLPISARQIFVKNYFPPTEREGGGHYGAHKKAKIKLEKDSSMLKCFNLTKF